MEGLYSKFKQIIAENAKLKHSNIDLQFKVDLLEEKLKMHSLPRDKDTEGEWLTEKQSELIEENIRLKEMLIQYEGKNEGVEFKLDDNRNKIDESERKFLNGIIEENQKIRDENLRNTNVQKKTEILLENNAILKAKISEVEAEIDSYKSYCKRFMKIVTGLLGYKIELKEEKITLLSLYAFDKDDIFVFNQNEDNLHLITNDFAITWQNEIQSYLVNGKSLPAFLSCITLELFNRKTFG